MLNYNAPIAIAAATVLSFATLTLTDASARSHAGGSAGVSRSSHVAHTRQPSRQARPARATSSRVGRTSRTATSSSLRPARGTTSSRISNILNRNRTAANTRPGTRTAANNSGALGNARALTHANTHPLQHTNPSSLATKLKAAQVTHIQQQIQAGTLPRAVGAMQIAHILHPAGTTGTTPTPGRQCFFGCDVTSRRTTGTPTTTGTGTNPRPPVGTNPTSRPPRQPRDSANAGFQGRDRGNGGGFGGGSFAGGNVGGGFAGGQSAGGVVGGGAGVARAVRVAAAPAPVAPANQAANCLTRQTLPDGTVLFQDVCTGESAVGSPAQDETQQQQ